MNGTGTSWIITKTVINVYICWRYKQNQTERHDEKPRHQKAVFWKFRQFLYLNFFLNSKSAFVAFVKYTLLKLYSYCTQNCNFHYFLDTRICFMTKIVQYLLRFCVSIFPKISKNDYRKSFIKNLLDSIWYALSLSVHNIPSHLYDLILARSNCY